MLSKCDVEHPSTRWVHWVHCRCCPHPPRALSCLCAQRVDPTISRVAGRCVAALQISRCPRHIKFTDFADHDRQDDLQSCCHVPSHTFHCSGLVFRGPRIPRAPFPMRVSTDLWTKGLPDQRPPSTPSLMFRKGANVSPSELHSFQELPRTTSRVPSFHLWC